ncbi:MULTISPECIES: glycosyltransferase family 87 protein [unclassified Bradyrhizobium]|uniref:glycosyltransferase family 87 protein n=1 Tax=unclassified Bradyrhizobium TaxID=2631580 RepID=UPI002916773C|nr:MULTISPECIES: glycosyltransferase family 87 protein [unclassified Bradyrhizobium]
MANSFRASRLEPQASLVPGGLFAVCFVLAWINASFFPAAYLCGGWIWDAHGLGIPTDFVNVWAAGKLALQGHPALAWDWDVQRAVELDVLKQDWPGGYFAWHYPPPFLFVAAFLAQLPYSIAFIGWVCASFVPYLVVMRAIVGRAFGFVLAAGFPIVFSNTIVGQNGFLTAALVGGTLYLLPVRPVLAGICLGLLTYKPQYGFLFPIVLIATGRWPTFVSAAITAVVLAGISTLAFGVESWQAFFHWMPTFSQAFLTEGKATWWKLQSIFSLIRYFGGTEALGWAFQWVLTAAVVVVLVAIWRSPVRYSLKAAALAVGTLLTTPYLFLYDMMVLAIAVAFLVRIGLKDGFRPYELPALGCAALLLIAFILFGVPVGLAANLIVGSLVLLRAGPWWRREPARAAHALAAA